MKRFLVNLLIFISCGIPIVVLSFLFIELDGYTDPFYLRFTTPKQTSLIIGTSRAAQGIEPAIINKALTRSDIYNYGFSIVHSSYGPTYYKSIQEKLIPEAKNGVFIVAVDPWSISGDAKNPNDSLFFPESKLALGLIDVVDESPNIYYVLRAYDKPFYNLFFGKKDSSIFLHNDGWLEISLSMDSVSVAERLKLKILEYKTNNLPNYKFSQLRFDYLVKTIDFLKQHGVVFLLRLPIHRKILEIENQLMPEFNERVAGLAKMMKIEYKDFNELKNRYNYTDGNHLYKKSAETVSSEIGDWINTLYK